MPPPLPEPVEGHTDEPRESGMPPPVPEPVEGPTINFHNRFDSASGMSVVRGGLVP
ncbi:conserved hypothetical protein [Plantibacter sp. T3]|nr:conserved hypothetical protein [Plantibacter sp. T3]